MVRRVGISVILSKSEGNLITSSSLRHPLVTAKPTPPIVIMTQVFRDSLRLFRVLTLHNLLTLTAHLQTGMIQMYLSPRSKPSLASHHLSTLTITQVCDPELLPFPLLHQLRTGTLLQLSHFPRHTGQAQPLHM